MSEIAFLNAVCIIWMLECIPFSISDVHSVNSTVLMSCTVHRYTYRVRWIHVVAEGSLLTTPARPATENFPEMPVQCSRSWITGVHLQAKVRQALMRSALPTRRASVLINETTKSLDFQRIIQGSETPNLPGTTEYICDCEVRACR